MDGRMKLGHGHVTPRPDGLKARCGGPGICHTCNEERCALELDEQELSAQLSASLEDREERARVRNLRLMNLGEWAEKHVIPELERASGRGAIGILRDRARALLKMVKSE